MTLEQAKEILNGNYDPGTGGLKADCQYVSWRPGENTICLDDAFTIDELEAMVVLVRASRQE
jgi:hypothetical protein